MTEPIHRASIKVVKQRVIGTETQSPEEDYLAIEDPLEITLIYERNGRMVGEETNRHHATPRP